MPKDLEPKLLRKGWAMTTSRAQAEMNIRIPTQRQLEDSQPELAAYRAANRIVGLNDAQVWDAMKRENADHVMSRSVLNDSLPRKSSQIEDTES